jgi:AcrR family transcriptional regulator
MEAESKRGRGKVRDESLRQSILDAAAGVLLEDGYRRFTIEGVAARSGASKVTIYKWWRSKGVLALDAYVQTVTEALVFPVTDDARSDIELQLCALIERLTSTAAGRAIRELLGAAQEDAELKQELLIRYLRPRRELAALAFGRLLGWDPVTRRADLDLVTDQVYGAIYNRLLFGIEPLDGSVARQLLDFWVGPPIKKQEPS